MLRIRSVFAVFALFAAWAAAAAEAELCGYLPVSARCAVCIQLDRILQLPEFAAVLQQPAAVKFLKACELDYGLRLSDVREVMLSADAEGRNAAGAVRFSSDRQLQAVLQNGSSWLRPEKDGSYFIDLEDAALSGLLCKRVAPGIIFCYESGRKIPSWSDVSSSWYRALKRSGALVFAYADLSGAKRISPVLSGVKTARAELWKNGKTVLLKGVVSCRNAQSAKELRAAAEMYYAVGCSLFARGEKPLADQLTKALKLRISGAELSAELACDPMLLYHLLTPFLAATVQTGGRF